MSWLPLELNRSVGLTAGEIKIYNTITKGSTLYHIHINYSFSFTCFRISNIIDIIITSLLYIKCFTHITFVYELYIIVDCFIVVLYCYVLLFYCHVLFIIYSRTKACELMFLLMYTRLKIKFILSYLILS